MASIMDTIKKGIAKADKIDDDKDLIVDNLNQSLKQLSQHLINDVSSNPQKYTLRDMKDLSIILNNLGAGAEEENNGNGTLPSVPPSISMYMNANLDAKAKESEIDDESSLNLKGLTADEVQKLIDNADKLQNEENYKEGND